MIAFKDWIVKFKGVNHAIGDFADDVEFDKEFPNISYFDGIYEYLKEEKGACDDVLEIFRDAFLLYELDRYRGGKKYGVQSENQTRLF